MTWCSAAKAQVRCDDNIRAAFSSPGKKDILHCPGNPWLTNPAGHPNQRVGKGKEAFEYQYGFLNCHLQERRWAVYILNWFSVGFGSVFRLH